MVQFSGMPGNGKLTDGLHFRNLRVRPSALAQNGMDMWWQGK